MMDDNSTQSWMLTVTLTNSEPDTITCQVVGEIDLYTAPDLVTKLAEASDGAAYLVIDLSGVTFIGSTGLQALIEARERQEASGRGLALVVNSRVRWLLGAVGIDDLFDLHDSLPTA